MCCYNLVAIATSGDTVVDTLQLRERLKRDIRQYRETSRVRLHRAISWLARAEREGGDPDAQFVFLWIAFNAVYAKAFGADESAKSQLAAFFSRLVAIDSRKQLAGVLLGQFTGPIRTLISNKFVFEPFWRALREHDSSGRWEEQFHASSKVATRAVLEGNVALVLRVVFDRLYVLRNQLVHGGATWDSTINREQVKDGARVMATVIPAIVELLLDHPAEDFGEVYYPVV